MQALRGEKRTRSRYSSPAANAPASANAASESSNTIADRPVERPKTMLDLWVEPPLPAPRPSFADHGIERHGVVANMAPLGTRPSSKIMKSATRPEGTDVGGRFAVGKRTGPSNTPFEAMTPEPPTDPPRPRSVSSKTDDLEQLSPKTPQPPSPEKSAPKPTVEGQSFGQSVFALSQSPLPTTTTTNVTTPISTAANMSLPVAPIATPVQAPPMLSIPPPAPLGADGEPLIDLDKTDKVIEDAVQLAVDRRRWPTAYALRILYDEARESNPPKVVRIIEAIYNTRATHAQVAEFRILMKEKKKEGKKDKAGEYYFNGDGSDPPPQPKFSSLNTALSYGTPTRPDTGVRSASDTQARASSIPHLSASPLKEYDIAHIAKKQKQSHFVSPYPPMPMNGLNGIFGAALGAGANGTPDAKPETPQENGASVDSPSQARSRSVSSSSSLSSIDEGILDSFVSPAGKQRGGRNNGSDNSSARHANSAPTETLAHHNLSSQPAPISAPQKNGPKTYTFSTVVPSTSSSASASASASAPAPSSSSNHKHHRHTHHSRKNSKPKPIATPNAEVDADNADEDMAPIALAHPASALSNASGPKFISYKVKNLDKVRGRAHDDNDQASRLKRSAREITNSSVETLESFERYQPPPPLADVDTASEGDFADVAPSRRPAKIRLLNNRTARPRSNYDSEDLSSPTLLSFQPDLAPGSVSASRAGTPSALSRPTRKAKSGSGLRVKTS